MNLRRNFGLFLGLWVTGTFEVRLSAFYMMRCHVLMGVRDKMLLFEYEVSPLYMMRYHVLVGVRDRML